MNHSLRFCYRKWTIFLSFILGGFAFSEQVLAQKIPTNFSPQYRPPLLAPAKAQIELRVLATADLHGYLSSNSEKPHGLLHLRTLVYQHRQQDPDVILLDAGDTFQGSLAAYYYGYIAPEQQQQNPFLQLMNHLQFDAMALGNHDLEISAKAVQQLRQQSKFPWLSANVFMKASQQLWLPPYLVVERKGIRIGILGLTTPGIPLWLDSTQVKALRFGGMVQAVEKWLPVLRQQENVDFIIGLFHSGTNSRYDRAIALQKGLPLPNAAGLVANHFPEINLIISGHAHRTFPRRSTTQLVRHRVPVVSPGKHAEGLSVVLLQFQEQNTRWQFTKAAYSFEHAKTQVDTDTDTEWASKIKLGLAKVERYMNQKTALILMQMPNPIEFRQCGLHLMRSALNAATQQKALALLPEWKWRDGAFPQVREPLRRRHLFQWMRYDNRGILVKLYGQQIKILLTTWHRQRKQRRIRLSSLLWPVGFSLQEQTQTWRINNLPLQKYKKYSVWITNYHWNGGSGVAHSALLDKSQVQLASKEFIKELVFQLLRKKEMLLPLACQSFLE